MTHINTKGTERHAKAAKFIKESTELHPEKIRHLPLDNWQRKQEIERMIEAKVAQALRLLKP